MRSRVVIFFALVAGGLVAPTHSRATDSLGAAEQAAFKAATAAVAQSVVQIRTVGGLEQVESVVLGEGPSTGLIVSADGYIVSSAFHFARQPSSILVTLADGRRLPATLVATDSSRLLVLLKVEATDLPVPLPVARDKLRVGQWAIAIGRTYRSDAVNTSVGVISALDRMYGKVLQTDAKVSPANYGGPLVDISGRVAGILVPMAPDSTSEIAGVSWYDSGIAFAVPLNDVLDRLPAMRRGEDQHRGIMGITLAGNSPHAPAEIAHVRSGSPAARAGLVAGDIVTHAGGYRVRTRAHLLRRVRPLYAGDRLPLTVKRGDDELELEVELVAKLDPYRRGYLGILPARLDTEGVTIRHIFPDSPATEADLREGDRIVRLGEVETKDIAAALTALNDLGAGDEVEVEVLRDEQRLIVRVALSALPLAIPGDLPGGGHDDGTAAADRSDPSQSGETMSVSVPTFDNECQIYVPDQGEQERSQALLVWLRGDLTATADDALASWRHVADREGIIIAVPNPADAARWDGVDMRYLGGLLKLLLRTHRIDANRVVVSGSATGGTLGCRFGLVARSSVRGVVVSDAPLPTLRSPPTADPAQRFSLLVRWSKDSPLAPLIAKQAQDWLADGLPLATLTYEAVAADDVASLDFVHVVAHWIDTLDRL